MTQKAYAQNILATFSMKNCTRTTIPVSKKIKLKIDMGEKIDSILKALWKNVCT